MAKGKVKVAKSFFFFIFLLLIFILSLSNQSRNVYLSSTMLMIKMIMDVLLAICTAINGTYFIYNLLNYYEDISKRRD